jgi:beta-glucosidase
MLDSFRFPDGFLWGAATAGHQVEGGNVASDWWAFEQSGQVPFHSGEACRHRELYAQDFDLARALGHNAHRFSVEWARIEPRPGRYDEDALDHYAAVVAALRRRGLEPVVTLHHFVAPAWFTAREGWLAADGPERFAAYVQRVVDRLAPDVRWWLTVNEPTVWAKHAYVTGDWPPCVRGDWGRSLRGLRAMARGHRLAYRIIHGRRPDAMVGLAHSAPYVVPSNPARALDRWAARARDLGLNRLLFALIGRPAERWLDFIGINYYNRTVVRWAPRGRAVLLGEDDDRPRDGEARRFSDMGWEIWPEGLAGTLRAFAAYRRPLLVTENGIATADEALRVDYLVAHLRAVAQAIREGVPVLGYLHWSLIDNFEWALGFAPRFGLCAVDFATQARTPRRVAAVYAEICRTGRLPA